MAFPVNKRNEYLQNRGDLLRSKSTRAGKFGPLALHLSQNRSRAVLTYSIAVASGARPAPNSFRCGLIPNRLLRLPPDREKTPRLAFDTHPLPFATRLNIR
jgi:hypothetical protein